MYKNKIRQESVSTIVDTNICNFDEILQPLIHSYENI